MDLGIEGKKAIVCASSSGLGLACATALAREGCSVVINGRHEGRLQSAKKHINGLTGKTVRYVVADINTSEGRDLLIESLPDPDILINNNAGPPPGSLPDWNHAAWIAALEANFLAPTMLIQQLVHGMRSRGFGRIVNITSAMVKSPRARMALSTSSRTALTAFSKALSIEVASDNVTINNLLPERIDTPRQAFMANKLMEEHGIDREEARRRISNTIAAKRFGRPEEFADACAFLCSAQAGFISGQNLQLDGGSYPGLI